MNSGRFVRQRMRVITGCAVAFAIFLGGARTAFAWGETGHKIVAYIAADSLAPPARAQIAAILGVADSSRSVAVAMARAAVLPDTAFREEDRASSRWHFIDLCLQDQKSDEPARCPAGDCVTAKIDEFAARLRGRNYDSWGAAGDLAFLIHLVGDVHQPLHAANNADEGGNCIRVRVGRRTETLHAFWDTTVVEQLEDELDSRSPGKTARILERLYSREQPALTWNESSAGDAAWESVTIARSQIYGALGIPLAPCLPRVHSCIAAPRVEIVIDESYLTHASYVAAERLARAGFRLASLLNQIWPSP